MCSAVSVLPPADISLYWSDEQLFLYLKQITPGLSIPKNENVTEDVNPYQHMPSNLPDIWFFIRSEQKKDSEHGFWRARGEARDIYTNSDIIGWRTTLEFYEGRAPHGQRTNWVMQEYKITQKRLHSNSNPKESGLLCRVFLSSGASPNPSVVPDPGSTTGQGSMTESQAGNMDDNSGPLAAAGGLMNFPVENMHDIDYFSNGDFLELADLRDPESRSSFSDNSSCVTLTSEECFDSLTLQDLEDPINLDEQVKDADVKFNVAASVRPNEVVMCPATLESLVSSNGRKSPAKALDKKFPDKRVRENAIKGQKVRNNGRKSPAKVLDKKFPDKKVPENAIKSQKARNNGRKSPAKDLDKKFLDKKVPENAIKSQKVRNNGRKSPAKVLDKKFPAKRVPENAIKSQKARNGNEGTSNSHNVATSSKKMNNNNNNNKAVPEGENKPLVGMMKKLKKYLCCMPF